MERPQRISKSLFDKGLRLFSVSLPLLILGACRDADQDLAAARTEIRRGRLESAESLLSGLDGPAVRELRALLQRRRQARRGFDRDLEVLEREYADRPIADLMGVLEERKRGEADPVLRERLAHEISRLEDRRAEGVARVGHGITRPAPREVAPADPGEAPPPSDPVLAEVLEDVRALRKRGAWAEARELLLRIDLDAPGYREALAPLRQAIEVEAGIQGKELLARVERLEASGNQAGARELLLAERWRYPDAGEAAAVHRRVEALWGMSSAESKPESRESRGGDPPQVEPPPAPRAKTLDASDKSVALGTIELMVRARELDEQGLFEAAVELWKEAEGVAGTESLRARCRMRAFASKARRALRSALVGRFTSSPEVFQGLGVTQMDSQSIRCDGELRSWNELSAETLDRMVEGLDLDGVARVGLALERLDRGRLDGSRGGLYQLHLAAETGEIDLDLIAGILAEERAEPLPEGGYVWQGGTWVSHAALKRSQRSQDLSALGERLAKERPTRRDAALQALLERVAEGEEARIVLEHGLEARLKRLAASLMRQTALLERLGKVAQLRRRLDERRREALELIFDTQTYFYPYDPPDPKLGKSAGDYWEVQDEVDRRVNYVRQIWIGKHDSVVLPPKFRSTLSDLEWTCAKLRTHAPGVLESVPESERGPAWLEGVDPRLPKIELHTFAWNQQERESLARARDIQAWNEERVGGPSGLSAREAEQLRITNEYRIMFGRTPLAWNAKLQQAARHHAEYMARTGIFGHEEAEDPENRGPLDRMRRVGYALGASENCVVGSKDPEGAHRSWVRSSGHHRNLLQDSYREMGCAAVGGYWTLTFGTSTDFETELEAWRD